jgi:hypothetical protein
LLELLKLESTSCGCAVVEPRCIVAVDTVGWDPWLKVEEVVEAWNYYEDAVEESPARVLFRVLRSCCCPPLRRLPPP